METHTLSRSLITHPDAVSVRPLDPTAVGGMTRGIFDPDKQLDPLLDLLQGSELKLHDAVELEVPDEATGVRGELSGPLEIVVDVGIQDGAVVLLEQDGAYCWSLPLSGAGLVVRQPGLIRFRIEPPAPSPTTTTSAVRGPMTDAVIGWIGGKIRAYVLRYVAGRTAEALAAWIDGDRPERLVSVSGSIPTSWLPPSKPLQVAAGRRLLLLVHGTFSSTGASFAGLTATAPGKALLGALQMNYDAVLGFDHCTLTRDPDENAQALFAALRALNLPASTTFDAVAYSRGGLVLRVLAEELLPRAGWPLQPGRLVFVGCTNGGTALANPANWKRLIDIYTNIVMASIRLLGLVPGLGATSATLGQVMESLGRFVQYMAEVAIDQRRVPGIAAMMPESAIVRRLNAGQPAPAKDVHYYVARAIFSPHVKAPGFTEGMRRAATDWLADALFTADNDLVVNTESMGAFGGHAARRRSQNDFTAADGIYHLIYFGADKLVEWLGDWLLDQPGLTARLVSGVVVLDADSLAGPALETVAALPADAPVILRRTVDNDLFCYVRPAGQLASQLRPLVEKAQAIQPPQQLGVNDRPQQQMQMQQQQQRDEPTLSVRLGPALTTALQLHESDAVQIFAAAPKVNWGGQPRTLQSYQARLPKLADAPEASGVVMSPDGTMAVLLDARQAKPSAPRIGAEPAPGREDVVVLGNIKRGAGSPVGSIFMSVRPETFVRHLPDPEPPVASPPHVGSPSETTSPPAPDTRVLPPDRAEASQIECYFQAEMPPHPPLDRPALVTVTLSAEAPAPASGATRKTASAKASPTLTIAVTATGRRNCSIEGPTSVDTLPPVPGQPATVSFLIRGKAQGEAEVWIEAFQAGRRMVVLALTPLFLDTTGRLSVTSIGATARIEGALIDLRIRDINRNDGDSVRLEYSIQSEELEILREEESVDHPDKTRLEFIRSIYDDIAKFWRTASQASPDDQTAFMQSFGDELRVAGSSLCDMLVPEKIRKILFDAWKAQRIGAVRVLTREPSIPWELLFLHDPGGRKNFGCFLAELGLVRWNAALGYPPTRLKIRAGNSFYLIPNYPARYQLAGAADDRALVERLFHATAVDPTLAGVRKFLEEAQFDLLHVACHGEAVRNRPWESGLMLSDADPAGQLRVLKAARVEQSETQASRPLVFLNACQVGMTEQGLVGAGGMAQAFLTGVQAGAVAAPMWSVLDGTASRFASEFFEELAAGGALAQAARRARRVAKGAGDPSWLAYSVWGHPYARLHIEQVIA